MRVILYTGNCKIHSELGSESALRLRESLLEVRALGMHCYYGVVFLRWVRLDVEELASLQGHLAYMYSHCNIRKARSLLHDSEERCIYLG